MSETQKSIARIFATQNRTQTSQFLVRLAQILAMLCIATRLFGLDVATQERNNYLGNWWQLASFHLGSNIDLNTPNGGAMGLNVGVSAGRNYMFLSDADIGVRARYLYTNSYASTHSLGAILYAHSWEQPNNGLFSFALGGGMLITHKNDLRSVGGYVEVGFALFKFFPLNGDLLYRASFYPPHNALGMAEMIHSIQIVFGFM